MKTLFVPVDFSGPSDNAALFAADLANDRQYDDIVLAANLYVPVFEQIIPSPDLLQITAADIQQKKERIRQQLEDLQSTIMRRLNGHTTVRLVITDLPLVRAILEQVREEKPAIVLLGSNSMDATDSSIIGLQLIELAKVIPVPLIIVPPKSSYLPVTTALIAGRFNSLACIDPLKLLSKIIHGPHPRLLLLDADASHGSRQTAADPSSAAQTALGEMLKGYEHQLYHLEDRNILQGVLKFADDNPVQLIIALPGRHSFLYHLTHQNIQHGIWLNAHKPVLILK